MFLGKGVIILRILLIALWPITFLFLIGYTERSVLTLVTRTFNSKYHLIAVVVYILAGIIFAITNYNLGNKEFYKQKSTLIAYIFSGISVVGFSAFWLLVVQGGAYINRFVWNTFLQIPISILSLVVGHTIFLTIKTVILYRRL